MVERQGWINARWLPEITSGLISGVLLITISVSFAALIFSGPLADSFINGAGLVLFGAFVVSLVIALTSSIPMIQSGPQDSPAAILALIAADIYRRMAGQATPMEFYATVVAAIIATTFLTGLVFLTLGRLRLGNLIRFVPYPVIGGFLAGTGWLLVLGAFGVLLGDTLDLAQAGSYFQSPVLWKWLSGTIFAVLMLALIRRYRHAWIFPAFIMFAIVVFYLFLLLSGGSIEAARSGGWLMGAMPAGNIWSLQNLLVIDQVDWNALTGDVGSILTIILLGAIAILLNASGLELMTRNDVDFNRELQSAGLANILASFGGGLPGYHYLGITVLTNRLGGRSRLTGIVCAATCAAALFFGAVLVSYFPVPILGGLLLFLGLAFLAEWLYDAWFKLPTIDWLLILGIVTVIAAFGFLEGVLVGVGIAIILFVVNYSRVQVIRNMLDGTSYRSTVDRSPGECQVLRQNGERVVVLRLQGFLFFGTAHNLLNRIRQRLMDRSLPQVRYLILDFAWVSGLDSSAVASFHRIKQLAEAQGVQLVLTQLSSEARRLLDRGGFDDQDSILIFPTLDYGMEWSENQFLNEAGQLDSSSVDLLGALLDEIAPPPHHRERLVAYLEKLAYEPGQVIIRQGDRSDAMYLIESGAAIAQYEKPGGGSIRMRTMRSGAVIGEIGLYYGDIRTASVIISDPCILYRLTKNAIQRMEVETPELAAAFHRWIASRMAERLSVNINTLAVLME
jgi:sulfate permease, SulP family